MDKSKNIFFEEEENYTQDNFLFKNEQDEKLKIHRKKCEDLISNLQLCLEKKEFEKFDNYFEPKSVLNRCNEEIIGRNLIKSYIQDIYNNEEIHLYNIRLLIDSRQRHIACEWVTRRRELSNKDSGNNNNNNGNNFEQGMAAWYIKLSPNDYTIRTWYIWIDKVNYKIDSLNIPLPKENWVPAPIQYYTRKEMNDFVREKLDKFEGEDLKGWSNCLSDDLVICPPWKEIAGKSCCVHGAEMFFDNYENTSISKIEQLYDETKPNWCAYLQIFSTTNKKTGKKGEDIDFIFNEYFNGKVRYWRSYFNSQKKDENQENTFKFFIQTVSKCIENEHHKENHTNNNTPSQLNKEKQQQQQNNNLNQKITGSGQN